jgi:histidine triad (HIT) family protein
MTLSAKPAYDDNNIFAKILRGEIPCHKVFEDDVALAFMDVMPRGDGHTLVIPKVAARGLLDMPPEALAALMPRVQTVATAVVIAFDAGGFVLQQFNEAMSGQQVFHLHFHILPVFPGIPLRPHTGEMQKPEILKAHAERVRSVLQAPSA